MVTSGTFRPTNGIPNDAFPAPAPAQDGGSALSAFHDTNPNGTWCLFVLDDEGLGRDSLAGWGLRIAHCGGPPTAKDDAFRVKEDRALRRAAPGVLANDADPDDGPLTARLVSGPAKGTLTLKADGSFAYKPKRNFVGTDRFVYEVEDAQGFTDRAAATIEVLAQPG